MEDIYWSEQSDGTHFCSYCGHDAPFIRYDLLGFREFFPEKCPHCGRMVKYTNERPYDLNIPICADCEVPHNEHIGCARLNGLVTPDYFFCGFGRKKER